MTGLHPMRRKTRRLFSPITIALLGSFLFSPFAFAQSGTLGTPFPAPSPNAALKYHQALLMMSALDESDRSLLQKPMWEVLPGEPDAATAARIKRMLYRSRDAIATAGKGSRLAECNFGIDFSDSGASTVLPHVQPMVELGRLLTLRGAYAQSKGRWEDAAIIYFDGIRMGRHLAAQPTLLEAIAGMQILENNYYALAHWATQCPHNRSVARIFGSFEVIADDLVQPARTVASEIGILSTEIDSIASVHPNGPWGTRVLLALRAELGEDEKANRKLAVQAAIESGVPKNAFQDEASFQKYLRDVKRTELRFGEAAAAAMLLPAQSRVARGEKLLQKYRKAVGAVGEDDLIDPAEVGAMFAAHEAKATLLRLCLALASNRGEDGYPGNLDEVASGFGGSVPKSPYDGSPVGYQRFDGGDSFQLLIEEVRVGSTVLPAVDFMNAAPSSPASEEGAE